MTESLTTVSYVNPLPMILSIAGIVAMWKIFEDRGEKGWKSLIPFYNILTLGRLCKSEDKAKKVIIFDLILFVLLFAFMFVVFYTAYTADSVSNAAAENLTIVFLAIAIALIVLGIVALVYTAQLFRAFDEANNGPSWMIILWILLPTAAYIYYAFIHKDSPQLIEDDSLEDSDSFEDLNI